MPKTSSGNIGTFFCVSCFISLVEYFCKCEDVLPKKVNNRNNTAVVAMSTVAGNGSGSMLHSSRLPEYMCIFLSVRECLRETVS